MANITAVMDPFLAWLQATRIATTVAQSSLLTGFLSAIHLIGFTLVMGGVLVSSLRLLGVALAERPVFEVAGPTGRGILLGLTISVASGLLLFAARAATAFENGIFQLKMLLLLGAAVFQFSLYGKVVRRASSGPGVLRATGALGLAVWFGVALAGCAFILLE